MRFIKPQRTDNPSIQGPWTPFTHEAPEINLAKIPSVRKYFWLKYCLLSRVFEIFSKDKTKDTAG